MNPDHLTSLLAAGAAADPTRPSACLDEHQIAGYVDGGLDDTAREQVQLHLADCRSCMALVGLLCRERDADAIDSVPRDVVSQTRTQAARGLQRRWHFAPQWAAAAALALAVPLLLQTGRNLDRGAEGQGRPESPATRTLASPATGLQVLAPGAGTAVDPRQMSFRWTEVSGTPYYDVRIVTDAGDVVIQERITGTTWQPPVRLDLQPGAEYFVHVDAYPSGDKAVSSDHVPFRVAD